LIGRDGRRQVGLVVPISMVGIQLDSCRGAGNSDMEGSGWFGGLAEGRCGSGMAMRNETWTGCGRSVGVGVVVGSVSVGSFALLSLVSFSWPVVSADGGCGWLAAFGNVEFCESGGREDGPEDGSGTTGVDS
jgi:hypothetical protein